MLGSFWLTTVFSATRLILKSAYGTTDGRIGTMSISATLRSVHDKRQLLHMRTAAGSASTKDCHGRRSRCLSKRTQVNPSAGGRAPLATEKGTPVNAPCPQYLQVEV